MKTFTYTTRCKTILGDLHTPVSTYLKVRDIFPQSALMESSDYHGCLLYTSLPRVFISIGLVFYLFYRSNILYFRHPRFFLLTEADDVYQIGQSVYNAAHSQNDEWNSSSRKWIK